MYTYRLQSARPVENNPDSDHFDKDGTITEGVAQGRQPWIDLKYTTQKCTPNKRVDKIHPILWTLYPVTC